MCYNYSTIKVKHFDVTLQKEILRWPNLLQQLYMTPSFQSSPSPKSPSSFLLSFLVQERLVPLGAWTLQLPSCLPIQHIPVH